MAQRPQARTEVNGESSRPPPLAIHLADVPSPGGGVAGGGVPMTSPVVTSPNNYRSLMGHMEAVSKRYLSASPVSPSGMSRSGATGAGLGEKPFSPKRPERVSLDPRSKPKASTFFSMFRQNSDTNIVQEEESKFNSLVEYNEYYRNIYSQSGSKSPRRLFLHACHELGIGPEYSLVSHLWSLDPEIDLSCYDMGDVRVQAFAGSLRAGLNPVIKSLDLRSNRIGDGGLDVLFDAIAEGKCQFDHLDLSNNQIHFHNLKQFPQVLSLGCLCELSLENNSLGNRGVHCLVDAIKADEVQTLTWLDLTRNEIDTQGAMHLASLLKGRCSLTALGLAWNSISMGGAVQLCDSLAVNSSLRTLDLAFNSLGNSLTADAVTALGKALAANTWLRHVDLSYNHINLTQCDTLAAYLTENITLLGLHMSGQPCDLDQDGFMIGKQLSTGGAEGGHHDRIMYYPKQTFNHNCWLCGRWREVQFEWSADQAGMTGFNGQVFVHMSTDKPPYTPRLMKDLGNSRYEIWKMVPPGKVEYYFSYKAPTVEGTTANPNAMTQQSADNLMSVLSHYKGVTKPTWQNVMSRVYAREIVADMRTFRGTKEMPSPRSGAPDASSHAAAKSGGGGLMSILGKATGIRTAIQKSVMYVDPLSLSSMPNLDTMCSKAVPRGGWQRAGHRATVVHHSWSVSASIFAPRPREVDSRDFYDENPRQMVDAKKRSVIPRAFDADAARGCMLDCLRRLVEVNDSPHLNEVVEVMHENWSLLQKVFKAYCCRGEDPFVMSRASFSTLLAECNLEVARSSSDVLFYSATSDKLEAAEILKRFNHIILKPSKHGMLRHQFLIAVISLASQQHTVAKIKMPTLTYCQSLIRLITDIKEKAARVDNDDFRQDWLYTEGVDEVLRKYEAPLRELYSKYSESKFSKSNVPSNLSGKLLSFEEFLKLLDHKRILNRSLTIRDARCCFVGSMLTVVQEVFLPQRCLSFVDFLEALSRGAYNRMLARQADGTISLDPDNFVDEVNKFVLECLGKDDGAHRDGAVAAGDKKSPPGGAKGNKRASKVHEDAAQDDSSRASNTSSAPPKSEASAKKILLASKPSVATTVTTEGTGAARRPSLDGKKPSTAATRRPSLEGPAAARPPVEGSGGAPRPTTSAARRPSVDGAGGAARPGAAGRRPSIEGGVGARRASIDALGGAKKAGADKDKDKDKDKR